jgi:hypothetical protein
MRLIIKRSYEPPSPGEEYSFPFVTHAFLELTDEEKEIINKYQLGKHVLTQSKYSITTLEDVVGGDRSVDSELDIAIRNEQVLRDACASLPTLFDYCRSFGKEIVFEYSS